MDLTKLFFYINIYKSYTLIVSLLEIKKGWWIVEDEIPVYLTWIVICANLSSNYHGNEIQNRISHSTNARSIYSQRSPIYQLVLNLLAFLLASWEPLFISGAPRIGARHCRPRGPRLHSQGPRIATNIRSSPGNDSNYFRGPGGGIEPRAFSPQLFQCDGALVHSPNSPHYYKVSLSY